jgi:hypothetical protein
MLQRCILTVKIGDCNSIGDKEIWHSPVVKDGHARDSVWHLSQPLDASALFDAESREGAKPAPRERILG